MSRSTAWRQWIFPIFWTLLFVSILALNTVGLAVNHPERLQGWLGVGFSALLLVIFGTHMLISWGRLYRDRATSTHTALIAVSIHLLALLMLVVWYDGSFAWISLTLVYQGIGGLPRRYWALPLAGVLLVLFVSAAPLGGQEPVDTEALLTAVLLVIVNGGIAVFIQLVSAQRDQLRTTLMQLQQAHTALALSTAQHEELAVLRERTRLARVMHDNIGHALVVVNVKLEAAQLLYARDAARGDAELEATRTLIRSTMTELRRALADLRAPETDYDNLKIALGRLAHEVQARSGIAMTCCIAPDLATLPTEAREALWYVGREALTNVERHAAAASATLTLEQRPDSWLLRVTDDGLGINSADLSRPGHYGLVGMRERMQALGGVLLVERGAAGGTIVVAQVPLDHRRPTTDDRHEARDTRHCHLRDSK
jgi:signal transduction histidine kinase